MSDTQARGIFEEYANECGYPVDRFVSTGAYKSEEMRVSWPMFLTGYSAGRKAGLEDARGAVADMRERAALEAVKWIGGDDGLASNIRALITKPGEKA